jgi:hypothetical protein
MLWSALLLEKKKRVCDARSRKMGKKCGDVTFSERDPVPDTLRVYDYER